MKKYPLALLLFLVTALAAACSAYAPTATPTPPTAPPAETPTPAQPSPTPSPTPPSPIPTPTPAPPPTRTPTPPASPTPPPSGLPSAIADLISRLSHEPVSDPPSAIFQYEYRGQAVYYLPPRCCDQFSDLYDAAGELMGHPDGGLTGQGDGKFPDFLRERKNEKLVWQDTRKHNPNLVLAVAPIEDVNVVILESFPPQYRAVVVSGLPNGCVTFAGYRIQRREDVLDVELLNWVPANARTICTQVYGAVETVIPLGSDFQRGKTYRLEVNGAATTFVGQ